MTEFDVDRLLEDIFDADDDRRLFYEALVAASQVDVLLGHVEWVAGERAGRGRRLSGVYGEMLELVGVKLTEVRDVLDREVG